MSSKHRQRGKIMCVLPHDPDEPAASGVFVCRDHKRRARHLVNALPALHTELEEYLTAGGGGGGGGDIVTGTKDPGLKMDTIVAGARWQILDFLAHWTKDAIRLKDEFAERDGVKRRKIIDTTKPTDAEPKTLAAWVIDRLDWFLLHYPEAFMGELVAATNKAKRQRQRDNPVTFPLGRPCPEPDCNGNLVTRFKRSESDHDIPAVIWCDLEPFDEETGTQLHIWPAGEGWQRLGAKIHRKEIQLKRVTDANVAG